MNILVDKMKSILLLLFILLISCSSNSINEFEIDDSAEYLQITKKIPTYEFERIKNFIIKYGDKQTYRNLDNDNPHYDFMEFHVYLNSEIGSKNNFNDPIISDFNEITIQDLDNNIRYYTFQIVRYGDKSNEDIKVSEGMIDGNVYLLNPYKESMIEMYESLDRYLNIICEEISKY